MSKPNPRLLERAHLIPYLQLDIEAGAGMRPNELCDVLAGPLGTKGASLLRKWFHWRQAPPGQQIPRVPELRALVNEVERRGWLTGRISPEATELLRFLEEDYKLRRNLARKHFEDELEPEIAKFSAKLFETLARWDSTAKAAACEKAKGSRPGQGPIRETASYRMGKPVEEKQVETYGLLDSIPVALKDISQALVDRIKEQWPDYETRPAELSPENLRRTAEFAGDPFLRFAAEAEKERQEYEEYRKEIKLLPPVPAESDGRPLGYRLGGKWKTNEIGKPE